MDNLKLQEKNLLQNKESNITSDAVISKKCYFKEIQVLEDNKIIAK